MTGELDAACMIDGNHLLFSSEGTLPPGRTRVLAQTPGYDHCNFTVTSRARGEQVEHLHRLLMSMSYADAAVRPLLDLEGLKAWKEGRTSGYALLEKAVDASKFYDAEGTIVEPDYRY
jgi:ABC-type phosphate/phosphonate transport system substrate-binding protein